MPRVEESNALAKPRRLFHIVPALCHLHSLFPFLFHMLLNLEVGGHRCHVHDLAFIGHLFLAPRMSVGTANQCKRKLCWPLHYSLGIIIFRRMTATWWSFSKSFPTKAYVLPSQGFWLGLQLQACEIGLKSPQKAVILNSRGTIAPLPILAGRSALYRICGCAQEHGPFPANSLLGAFQHHEILPAGEGF